MKKLYSRRFIAFVFFLCVSAFFDRSLRADDSNAVKAPTSRVAKSQETAMAALENDDTTMSATPGIMTETAIANEASPIDLGSSALLAPSTPTELPDVNPNRPSNSNSAEVLAQGLIQMEYGYNKNWEPAGNRQTTLGGEVRFGIWRNAEFRWGSNPLVGNLDPSGSTFGMGDQYFSGQFQFQKQTEKAPALAVSYAVTVPTGNESLGFGTGRVSHTWTFLASKDFHNITCDFNAQYELLGRQGETGHDQNAVFFLAFQRPIYGPLSVIAEFGEATRLNAETPANSTTLGALAYKLNRRVVLDLAIDAGITQGAPQKRIAVGITYVIGKLY